MVTAVNCFLLWSFTWFQFLIQLSTFSYRGWNLSPYTTTAEPFGVSTPKLFFGFSVALSVFAVTAVVGGTRSTPKLWKRLLAVSIFATIVIGFSGTILHLRHYSYRQALSHREFLQKRYDSQQLVHSDDSDDQQRWLELDRNRIRHLDAMIRRYEESYDIPRSSSANDGK